MTEADWLACTDPQPMLDVLRGRAGDRKLRLFACACCRRIWPYLYTDRARTAVDVSERYADGRATRRETIAAYGATTGTSHAELAAGWAAKFGKVKAPRRAAAFAAIASSPDVGPAERDLRTRLDHAARPRDPYIAAEQRSQCDLLRDIFGNPFAPLTLGLTERTPAVLRLARAMYDTRTFDRMPALADALVAAGGADRAVLEHCRSGGEHVRGCWVVDLVLGRK